MAVTDPTAIGFSNNRGRTSADLLSQCYYRASALITRWNSLGGGQAALNVMSADIRNMGDRLMAAYEFCFRTEKIWFLLGASTLIPNTATAISDSSPGDGRPAITGAQENAVINRVVEFQNWLFSATESFTDAARNNAAAYNTVLQASNNGPATIAVSDAGNLINRCTELTANYQANANANLGTLLAVAVNPNQ